MGRGREAENKQVYTYVRVHAVLSAIEKTKATLGGGWRMIRVGVE